MAKSEYYVHLEWSPWETKMPGYHNVIHQPRGENRFATTVYKTRPNETIH